jgi:histone acetyltransferase HTATIP
LGSPEKPLSDLGLLSYRAYWAETIVELLINTSDDLSIDDIAQKTAITHLDVMNTYDPSYLPSSLLMKQLIFSSAVRCTTLQLFKHYKGQHIICLPDAIIERHQKSRNKQRRKIHPENLIWKPPVFTRDQLRFGW